jgi:hypothetical protein
MWYQLTENPMAISQLYQEVPALTNVLVKNINLSYSGPTLTIDMDLPRFVDNPPARWQKEYNAAHIQLELCSIDNLRLDGWTVEPILCITMKQKGENKYVEAIGPDSRFSLTCQRIYIRRVSGYIKELNESPIARRDKT